MKKSTFPKPIKNLTNFKSKVQESFPDWKLKHIDFTKEIRLTNKKMSLQINVLDDQTRLISGLNFFSSFLLLIFGIGFALIVICNEIILKANDLGLSPIGVAIAFLIYLIIVVVYFEKFDTNYRLSINQSHQRMENLIKLSI